MTDQAPKAESILVESMTPIEADDIDFFIIFMESKRHSGGGDLADYERLDPFGCLFKMTYQDNEARDRVLHKRLLKFKNYLLRASRQSTTSDSQAPLATSSLLIRNFPGNDEKLIRLYADYLQADNNEILSIEFSNILSNLCAVTYSSQIDREILKQRHQKRSVVNQSEISLLDAYRTCSLIVSGKKKQDGRVLLTQLVEFIRDKVTHNDQELFFAKLTDKFILIECNSDQYCDRIRSQLANSELLTQASLCVEYIHSPELLKDYEAITPAIFAQSNEAKHVKNEPTESTDDKEVESRTNTQPPLLNLDTTLPVSITLVNCNQALANLNHFFKSQNLNLIAERQKDTETNKYSICIYEQQSDNSQAVNVVNEVIKKFQATELGQDMIKLQSKSKPAQLELPFDLIQAKIDEKMTRYKSICYFELDRVNQQIVCYGVKKHLGKHMVSLRDELEKLELAAVGKIQTQSNQDDTLISVQSNTALYVCLKELNSIRSAFQSRLAELYSKLVMKDTSIGVVVDNQSNLKNINSLIQQYEEQTLTRQRINLTTMLNIKTKEQRNTLEEFKNQIYGAFGSPKKFGYRFETEKNEDYVLVYGMKSAVENFKAEARKKYINMINRTNRTETEKDNKPPVKVNQPPTKSASTTDNSKQGFEFTKEGDILIKDFNSMEFVVLNNFNGKYFSELAKLLANFHYQLDQRTKYGGFRARLMAGSSSPGMRQSLIKPLTHFFARFIQRDIEGKRKDLNGLRLDSSMITAQSISSDRVRLTGLLPEVNRVVKALGGKNKPTSQPTAAPGGVLKTQDLNSGNKIEKFLINELKWYQTRILFEKKYFEQVSNTFKDLQVTLNKEMTMICYTGRRSDIEKAKQKALDILSQILGAEIECDPRLVDKVLKNNGHYSNLIRQAKICCIIDAQGSGKTTTANSRPPQPPSLTIYGTSVDDIKRCHELLLAHSN